MSGANLAAVTIQKGHSSRARRGYPWLFSNEINMSPEARALPPGSLVRLIDAGSEVLGIATFNPHSLIAARILTRVADEAIDGAFIESRLKSALALRDRLFPVPHYRLVHAEADGLPGLIIDRFGDVLTVQANTAGMDVLTPLVLDALESLLSPRAIVLRNDSPSRLHERLPQSYSVARGSLSDAVEVIENGVRFMADLATGQKTGWFFDQRPNRAFVASLAREQSVIDVFSYAGGFGLQALAGGATSALLVDSSAEALALATASADLNGFADRCTTRQGDAFKVMEDIGREGTRFGVVIADPPAFVKAKKDLATGAKGYRKMARMAATLTAPGGILLAGSCSHHMPAERFLEEVTRGITAADRSGRLLWSHGAGPDHPIHPMLPESAYLKGLVFQLD